MPVALRSTRVLTGFVALIGAVYWCYCFQRLHHTDLWGHLAYGRLVSTAHILPATEPLMPLAEGMPLVDTAWLSQLLGYRVLAQWGLSGVQFLHAAAIATCLALLSYGFYRRTRSFVISSARDLPCSRFSTGFNSRSSGRSWRGWFASSCSWPCCRRGGNGESSICLGSDPTDNRPVGQPARLVCRRVGPGGLRSYRPNDRRLAQNTTIVCLALRLRPSAGISC